MEQIQHQMFVTGRLYCDFEDFLVKESVTKNYERREL